MMLLFCFIYVTKDSGISEKSPDLLVEFLFIEGWGIIKGFVLSADKFELQSCHLLS